jgi:hypothetical protein
MKKALIACAAGALLVAPGATAKPTKTDRTNAAKECRAERGTTDATVEAFRVKYGTNKSGRNAFGKCVSGTSKEEAAERRAAASNAAKECKAERDANAALFAETHGTNKNNRNAFGKCVSSKAKENKEEADTEDAEDAEERKSAAKECDAERATGEVAFANKYGTNANKRNAFGKCVSQKASA